LRLNANAVVTHPDLDAFVELAGRDLQERAESSIARTAALGNGIESVADEVEEHATDILRHNLDRRQIAVEVEFQCDLEIPVLCPGAVIGEVQALLDQRVQIGRLPIAAAAARVLQHAPDNAVGATTMFGYLFEVACQHPNCLQNLCALAGIECADCLGRRSLQFLEQLDREAG